MFRRLPGGYTVILGGEGGEEQVWAGSALTWEEKECRRLFPMEIQAVS